MPLMFGSECNASELHDPAPTDQIFPGGRRSPGVAEAGSASGTDLAPVGARRRARVVAGVFTWNRFCAAPVHLCRDHLAGGKEIRAGHQYRHRQCRHWRNPAVRPPGYDAKRSANCFGVAPEQVLLFSTGVWILENLPVDRIRRGLPAALADLRADNWRVAAHAIMTTDTSSRLLAQTAAVDGKIAPFPACPRRRRSSRTWRPCSAFCHRRRHRPVAARCTGRPAADDSFNCITVDGDNVDQ